MKMKKVKEVCKRIGVGLLSAALLLTGGSFSQVRSAKAEETESFSLGHFPMNIMVLVPKEVADLSAESKELLSTGAFNRSGQVGGGAVIDVENVTPLENYDNKYNGYKVKLWVWVVNAQIPAIPKVALPLIKNTYFSGKLIYKYHDTGTEEQFVNMFTPKAGYEETYTTDVITEENSKAVSFLTNFAKIVNEAAAVSNPSMLDFTVNAICNEKTYEAVATIKDICGSKVLGTNTYTFGTNRKFTSAITNCSGQVAGTRNGSYPGYKIKSYGTGSFPANSETTNITIVNQWEVCDHSEMNYTRNENGSTHNEACNVCGFAKNNVSCDFELLSEEEATCGSQSTETYRCPKCGRTKVTHKKAATGHSYTLMDVKADALYQPATCVTAPKYYYSCANCGKVEGDANHVFSNGDVLGHDYQTVYEDNNGIHNGKESKVCSRCHDEKDVKYLLYIDPLDAIKNDVAFTSGFGYYSKGQQVQVQGLANVNKTIGYGTPYYVYNDKKLDISTGIITMPDHAISVSLTADLEVYNLNFVVPHGWMTVPTQNFKYGEGVSTLAMPAMDTGYQFLGWYDNKDCTGEPVTSIAATEHADKTLYGKTEVITYNIDYEFGGTKGIGIDSIKVDDSAVKSYNIESKKIMLPTADEIELVGDTVNTDKVEFEGWYDDESLESDAKVTSIDTGSFGDKVLYAKYEVKDSDDGGSTPTPPAITATPSPTPSATPSVKPTEIPSTAPTATATPSITPTVKPSASPSTSPSTKPSSRPSSAPTVKPSDSPNPTVKPQETADTKPQTTSDVQATSSTKPVTVNVVTKGGITYKVKGKSCVVTKSNKKIKKAVIQKKVKFVINGKTVTYKVTGIEKNAFKNCKKLKSLTIKSTTIKKIAKNTFKGVSKKCKVKVPKKQFKKYRKLLKKAKFKGKVKK